MGNSTRYDYWHEQYMLNCVRIETLNKLVKANKLRQDEVDTMIADRLEKYNY
ncbi:MAG: hypothetical protein ACRDA4_00185 [Filifactoraceae bacterium]